MKLAVATRATTPAWLRVFPGEFHKARATAHQNPSSFGSMWLVCQEGKTPTEELASFYKARSLAVLAAELLKLPPQGFPVDAVQRLL